ncbi:MAG: 2,3-bisphosphoglycerate-independent phosphoglycerate mutase [Patescibacteria group bacterium]
MKQKNPTLLIILDGWGVAPPSRGNAISLARKPFFDQIYKTYPSCVLGATGRSVGLEDNKMSGSEAGHINIGAGRIVPQDSYFIYKSIQDGSFFMNPALCSTMEHVRHSGGRLHILGLMGNTDSPHSDPRHFEAILKMAKDSEVKEVFCHLFTDGRDSYPKSALEHLEHYEGLMKKIGVGRIATLCGRFYAMDRTKKWDRLMKAYDAMVFARGKEVSSTREAIESAYQDGLTDEYILPSIIFEKGKPLARIGDGDAVIFFNFRSDRARQLTKIFVGTNKRAILNDSMPVVDRIKNFRFTVLTGFGPDLDVETAFPSHTISATLPMALRGKKQLYTSETEKYAHVTYFLNGGYADPVAGEERIMVESPKVSSYADVPQMSAEILTDNLIQYIRHDIYDFMTINFPNADMVGHTGDLSATVRAVEVLDKEVKKLTEEILKREGQVIITADHGNADDMIDFHTNQPNTFHTKNPVPLILVGDKFRDKKLRDGGVLGNIAPTILEIMGVEKPRAMKEESLLG